LSELLLDTHVLLWWRGDYRRISARAREAIADPGHGLFFSAASIWEMAIKHAAGKLKTPPDILDTFEQRGFTELRMSSRQSLIAGALPPHHGDPFDRMLVAQAQSEKLTLVTNDARIAAYDVPVLW
jgi:PIN domain nuclease of toxin-antitoxin system